MANIQQEILDAFFERLKEAEGFDSDKADALKVLLEQSKKPKATDVVAVLSADNEETVP